MQELLQRIQRLEKTENVTKTASPASPAMAKSTKKPRSNKTKLQKERKLVAAAARARSDSNSFGVLRADQLVGHSLFGEPSTEYEDFKQDMMQRIGAVDSSDKLVQAKSDFIQAMEPCQTLFEEMAEARKTALTKHHDFTLLMDLICKNMLSVRVIMAIDKCHSNLLRGDMNAFELNAELCQNNFEEFERLRHGTSDQSSAHDNLTNLTLSLSLKAAHITLALYEVIASERNMQGSGLTDLCKCNESHVNIIKEFVKRAGELAHALRMPEVNHCCSGHLPKLLLEFADGSLVK